MRTVTAVRTAGVDRAGDVIEGPGDRWEIENVELAPVDAREETEAGRSAVLHQFDLFARGQTETGLAAGDRIEDGDTTYEVDGEPAVWPLGTVVRMKRVSG